MRTSSSAPCIASSGMLPQRAILFASLVTSVFVIVSSAAAGMLADFMPQPASPYSPELNWSGSELDAGPGASSLAVETPFLINGVPGGVVSGNSTSFSGASLTLDIVQSPAEVGTATTIPLGGGITIFSQVLGSGSFSIASASEGDPGPVTLLSGTINNAIITGILGSPSGSVVATSVTYTGGAIWQAAGSPQNPGELSWSLLDASPAFHISNNQVGTFTANSTGQFSVPEPRAAIARVQRSRFAAFRLLAAAKLEGTSFSHNNPKSEATASM